MIEKRDKRSLPYLTLRITCTRCRSSEGAEVIHDAQKCHFSKWCMPQDRQDHLTASNIQYEHLDELGLYFSRIKRNGDHPTTRKAHDMVLHLVVAIEGRNRTGPNKRTRNAKLRLRSADLCALQTLQSAKFLR